MADLMNIEFLTFICVLFIAIGVLIIAFIKSVELRLRRVEHAANLVTEFNSERISSAQSSVKRLLGLEYGTDYEKLTDIYTRIYQGVEHSEHDRITLDNALTILNFYEHVAQTIEAKVADEKYLKIYFRTLLVRSFQLYRPLIYRMRDVSAAPAIFIAQEKLAHRWNLEYQNNILLRILKTRQGLR